MQIGELTPGKGGELQIKKIKASRFSASLGPRSTLVGAFVPHSYSRVAQVLHHYPHCDNSMA